MASPLIFVAFSLFAFIVVFSVLFQFMPIILGSVGNALDTVIALNAINADWLLIYESTDDTVQLIIPLMMSLGVVLLVVKVLMIASNRSAD